jgi:hypothetical protein
VKPTCPRLFEVEALRDGRLRGPELVRFQAHLRTCADCTREAQDLELLAARLRAPANQPTTDQLHVRRERTRLLAAFDERLAPTRTPNKRRWLGLAAAVVTLSVVAGLAFVVWPARQAPAPVSFVAPASDPVTVRADSSAQWSRRAENHIDRIFLHRGALSIHVEQAQPPRRLLVMLPDGELEDIGTTFSVSADSGQTTRVTVQAGSVVLRLRGKPAIVLGAGDAWAPPPPQPVAVPSSSTPAPSAPVPAAKPSPAARGLNSPLPSVDAEPSDPAVDFRAATAAFNGGDNINAAARFDAFVTAHPRDPRAQDAAYLRILALQRSGNSAAMQQAARNYLSRYPGAFRRAEVEALAGMSPVDTKRALP